MVTRPTQPSVPPWSANEDQLRPWRQRPVSFILFVNKRLGVQLKLWNSSTTRAIPQRLCSESPRGALSSVWAFISHTSLTVTVKVNVGLTLGAPIDVNLPAHLRACQVESSCFGFKQSTSSRFEVEFQSSWVELQNKVTSGPHTRWGLKLRKGQD